MTYEINITAMTTAQAIEAISDHTNGLRMGAEAIIEDNVWTDELDRRIKDDIISQLRASEEFLDHYIALLSHFDPDQPLVHIAQAAKRTVIGVKEEIRELLVTAYMKVF